MNILVLLTGGTIGSKISGDSISVNHTDTCEIVSQYDDKSVNFTVEELLSILSENICYDEWNTLVSYLNNNDFTDFDGIIILHGTDTLAYTASLLSQLFDFMPIVLVSSNSVPGLPDSNGFENFAAAVSLIKAKQNGVFVTFFDNLTSHVFCGNSIMPADNSHDVFWDYYFEEFGEIKDNKLIKSNFARYPDVINIPDSFKFENEILLITPYPNINYDNYNTENVSAILHLLYHSSTASEKVLDFIGAQNKSVYIAPFKKSDAHYETTHKILKAGAVPLYDCSPITAYTRLCINYNLKKELENLI